MKNPILARELTTILRSKKTFYLMVVYLLSLFVLVSAVWPREGIYSFAEGASQSILTLVAMGQLLLVTLFSPAFSAAAIVGEKENNSFDMLFATLLRPPEIITGKLLASLAGIFLITFSALPITSVCFFLGGVGLKEVAQVYAVLAATAVFFGIMSLAVSSLARSSHSAMIWSYVLILFLSVGIMLPYYVLEEWTLLKPILIRVKSFSPFASMLSVVQPQVWLKAGEKITTHASWMNFIAMAGAGTTLLVGFLFIIISRPHTPKSRSRDVLVSGMKDVMKRKLKFPFYLIDPMKRKRLISGLTNCVFEKERRSRMFGNLTYIVRGMYVCLMVSLGITILSCLHLGVRHLDFLVMIAMAFQLGMVALVVPSLTAGSITQEIETGNMDMLRMTPLRPWTIISGKIQYAVMMLVFLLLSCAPFWYMLAYLEAINTNLLPALAVLGATVVFSVSCGIMCSTFARKTSTATAISYGIMILICVVTLLPAFLPDVIHYSARSFIMSLNPFAASVQIVASDMFRDLPGLWQANLKFLLIASAVFLIAAMFRLSYIMKRDR